MSTKKSDDAEVRLGTGQVFFDVAAQSAIPDKAAVGVAILVLGLVATVWVAAAM